jgi:hypothetical protein
MPPLWIEFDFETAALPICIEPSGDHPGIAKLGEGRFHIWRSGTLGALLSTASAILVSRAFADVLAAETTVGWRIREVTIVDPPAREISGYVEVLVDEELAPGSLPSNLSGKRVWRFGPNHLFASPELAKILGARFPDLLLSLGFSRFAG